MCESAQKPEDEACARVRGISRQAQAEESVKLKHVPNLFPMKPKVKVKALQKIAVDS